MSIKNDSTLSFSEKFERVLDISRKFSESPPHVPELAFSTRLMMEWAMSEDLSQLPPESRIRWLELTLDTLPKLGQAHLVAEYFSKYPSLKKTVPNNVFTQIVYVLCRYYSETGQFSKCDKELQEAKTRFKDWPPSLKLDQAKNLYFQGHIEDALKTVSQVCADAEKTSDESIVPWTYGVVASMQIQLNLLKEATKTLEHYRRRLAKTDQNPWFNSAYVPRIHGSILIHQGQYSQARKVLAQLRSSIIKNSGGVATVHLAWTDFYLLTIAALTKKPTDVERFHKHLKADLVTLSTLRHLGIFAEAIVAASKDLKAKSGAMSPTIKQILEPASRQLGAQHPDLQDTERLIGKINLTL